MNDLIYIEARILKDAGEKVNVKVTLEIVGNEIMFHMRDFTFYNYENAAKFLRGVLETELMFEKELKAEAVS